MNIISKEAEKQPISFKETSLFSQFTQAINSAQFNNGQLDIKKVNYITTVEMKDDTSRTFSFWIKRDYIGLYIIDDHNGHYRLNADSKNKLLEIFDSVFKAGGS